MLTAYWTILIIAILIVFGDMHQVDPHCFHWILGTRFTRRNKSFLKQIVQKNGIELLFQLTDQHAILQSIVPWIFLDVKNQWPESLRCKL